VIVIDPVYVPLGVTVKFPLGLFTQPESGVGVERVAS
jgi:hypothetical protein